MTDTPDDDDNAAKRRREELWEAFLYPFLKKHPSSDLDRQQAALTLIAGLLNAANPEDARGQRNAFRHVAVLVQLLGAEIGRALFELDARGGLLEPDDAARTDTQLGRLLDVLDICVPPLQLAALDPAVLIVPRALRKELRAAVAMAEGDRNREWNEARARALQLVEFQRTQGYMKKAFRAQLGIAMGVEGETIRKWKDELAPSMPDLETRLEDARAAGRLANKLQENPDFGSRPGESLDQHVLQLVLEIRDEPWEAFAKRYREQFGTPTSPSRH